MKYFSPAPILPLLPNMPTVHIKSHEQATPQPLAITGISPAPMTPAPDDAEIAAQALLEIILEKQSHKRKHKSKKAKRKATPDKQHPVVHDKAYYQHLAERIKEAHAEARKRTLRFVSFVEQELKKPDLPATGEGSLGLLETELYKRIDTVDREQGELKERWQNCLAEVTLRRMEVEEAKETEESDSSDTDDSDE